MGTTNGSVIGCNICLTDQNYLRSMTAVLQTAGTPAAVAVGTQEMADDVPLPVTGVFN